MKKQKMYALMFAFFVVVVATFVNGYDFISQSVTSTSLAWFQRICMYPLVILFGVALMRKDAAVIHSAAPLAGIGFCITVYEYITTQQLSTLILAAFLLIMICCIYLLILEKKEIILENSSAYE